MPYTETGNGIEIGTSKALLTPQEEKFAIEALGIINLCVVDNKTADLPMLIPALREYYADDEGITIGDTFFDAVLMLTKNPAFLERRPVRSREEIILGVGIDTG